MKIFVRFPCDEGNRVIDFKDMPVIRQQVYMEPEGRFYLVTEILKISKPGYEASLLVRRSGR